MISDSPKQQQGKPFGIEDQMTTKQTQGVPVAYLAGTRKVSITWMTKIYNVFALPGQSTGKKG